MAWLRLVVNAILAGTIWGLSYYWIRKGLNPEVTDLKKYRKDAFYGSICAAVTFGVSVVVIRSEIIADAVMTAVSPVPRERLESRGPVPDGDPLT